VDFSAAFARALAVKACACVLRTHSAENFFTNTFSKRGFVDDNTHRLTVHQTLPGIVLHDSPASDH